MNSKEIIALLKQQPRSSRQLVKAMQVPRKRRLEITRLLHQLQAEGKIARMRGGLYRLVQPPRLYLGRLQQTQPGFAFFIPEKEGEPDLFIPGSELNNALPNDRIAVRMVQRPGTRGPSHRQIAQVVDILERGNQQIVGTFQSGKTYGWVKPEGLSMMPTFHISQPAQGQAQPGDKVVAKVTVWPEGGRPGQAEIIEVLGPRDQPGVDITLIVRRLKLVDVFSVPALAEARQMALEPQEKDWQGRKDLRAQTIVTIDGADARDFDDAVNCEEKPEGGWRLGVHIADVSHYLKEGTGLDLEARNRGTSVYLPDRVLHMLPEELSCGVCSLVPGKDRLTVSAVLDITPEGKVTAAKFYRSVIRSAARLTYDGVETVLNHQPEDNPAWVFAPELRRLQAVARALRQERWQRGSLDFDLPEPKIVLGPDGRVQTIEKRVQKESHRLIEDCMIAANEAVASYLKRTDTPALYRAHAAPAGEKLAELKLFLEAYGYALPKVKPQQASRAFQDLLRSWQGKPEEALLNMTLLRSMKLAVYAPKNIGHFGLGSSCYTHFTSPIRRYPDLIVHRMLTERLEQGPIAGKRRDDLIHQLPQWGNDLSAAERLAEKAEREAVKVKQLEFMADKVGEVFTGKILNVTNFGFFVELQEHYVEGLVRTIDLPDDYYRFEELARYLKGVNTGREFRTGQKVMVRVAEINAEENRVIFVLAEESLKRLKPHQANAPRIVSRRRSR